MAAAAATRVENPEATVSQSQPSVANETANSDSISQSPTVSPSSITPQPPENSSSAVGVEPKVPEDSTSSDGAAAVLLTEAQKKIRRSERFGVPVKLSEGEKKDSRAERFGSVVGAKGSDASKKSEEQKKVARAERFGLVQQSTTDDNEARKKARHARFAPSSVVDSVEEDKRKARAARFSQDQPASLSNTNGKEQSEVDQSSAGT